MFEFLGALAGRAIIKEGRLNAEAISGGLIGITIMGAVSIHSGESFVPYIGSFIKYTGSWVFASLLLGSVSAGLSGFQWKTDYNPRTSAWPSGPHLHPIFQAMREVFAGFTAAFYPPDRQVLIVYNRLDRATMIGTIVFICGFLILQGYLEDNRWKSSLAKIQRTANRPKSL